MVFAATAYLSVVAFGLLLLNIALRAVAWRRFRDGRDQKTGQGAADVPAASGSVNAVNEVMPKPPGPKPLPVLGSLHLLGQHEVPFEAFTALSKIYGDIYSISLGAIPCVVVNNFALIKEVLITKGAHFGGRPDFIRFHKLFGGDRNNSLALCDWSSLQKTRRSIARTYCSPRFTSIQYDSVNAVGCAEMQSMLAQMQTIPPGAEFHVKPLVMAACANMFTQYMCTTRFPYGDPGFRETVRYFDDIFWEINQGYAIDFLPWLEVFYGRHLRRLSTWAHDIRQFILARIIDEHRSTLDLHAPPRDFTDALLMHLEEDPNMSWEHIIFELEDFLGGHSAIGNLVMITLAEVVRHPEVAARIQAEVDSATERGARSVTLFDKERMPYTEAAILETLRTSSSPIVPHVATLDTSIAGFAVDKGTVVFINNYELNLGEQYWEDATRFRPERFVTAEGGILKPAHFIPFSTGKRTCIGQRLVQGFTFIMLATLLQRYDIGSSDLSKVVTKPGCMAVPPDCFSLCFTPRRPMTP